MTGLFSRKPRDPGQKINAEKLKEFKKLVKDKKYDRALRSGEQYLRRVPNDHNALFTVGGIHYMRGRYAAAVPYLDRALDVASYDVDALLLKAYCHQRLGQDKQAARCCEKVMEVDPKNGQASSLLGKLNRPS